MFVDNNLYYYVRIYRQSTDSYITVFEPTGLTGYDIDQAYPNLYAGWDVIHYSIDCPKWST
jgi:hypothetical protein